MKKIYTFFVAIACIGMMHAQSVPELIYYKFNTGTTIPNEASSPVGTPNATIAGSGLSVGGTGLTGTGLVGTGTSSTSDYINTGWSTSLTGSWTIGFYTANVPTSSTLFYIFGDLSASSFRCFTNGVAGAGNWMLRGTGLPDVTATGAAVSAGKYVHFVYDATASQIRSYVDGVLSNTGTVSSPISLSGTQFKVGAYSSNSNLSGVMDEFRFYNRALTLAEIQATWNITLGGCASADSLATANIGCDKVDISWVSDTSAIASKIEYGPIGFTPGTGTVVPATSNPFTLTGLSPAQGYHIYVQDSCSAGKSQPAGPKLFSTLLLPTANFSYQLFFTNLNWSQYDFNASPSINANSFTWLFGDGTSDTGKTVSHQYTQNGPVTVTLIAENDCGPDSLSINLNIQNIGVNDYVLKSIRIYPNPTNDALHFEGLQHGQTTITLVDATGKAVYRAEESSEKHTVNISHLASGIYFVTLKTEQETVQTKIVKID